MTNERLQEIIAVGESLDVDFKGEERKTLSYDDLAEVVVCLANRSSVSPTWLLCVALYDRLVRQGTKWAPLMHGGIKIRPCTNHKCSHAKNISFLRSATAKHQYMQRL